MKASYEADKNNAGTRVTHTHIYVCLGVYKRMEQNGMEWSLKKWNGMEQNGMDLVGK